MTSEQPDPYVAPKTDVGVSHKEKIDPVLLKKIEAIIKDADQFWLAIIMCIVCSALGAIIIGPWYFVRLTHWKSMARAQPMLLDRSVPHGSIAERFQSAKLKLIIGMSFGVVILLLVGLLLVATVAISMLPVVR